MSKADAVKRKLAENAVKVDAFIMGMLEDRRPAVLYEASRHLIAAGGKKLRPFLVVKSCEAVGGSPDDAVPFAAALEILHNFTLVHDDVMDNDEFRRGAPTVHAKWGVPVAIAAGDLLFAKVFEAMTGYIPEGMSGERVLTAVRATTEATISLCEGQTLDVSYPQTADVSEDDYLFMVGGKTSALFKACAQVGAIVGGGSPEEVGALGEFAWNAGIAFQIFDDYLGATAYEGELGKPVGSDLREGKKTLIVIHALENASQEQRAEIMSVMGKPDASPEDLDRVNRVLRDVGSIDYALQRARRFTDNAFRHLEILPDSKAKSDLRELVDYFVNRAY